MAMISRLLTGALLLAFFAHGAWSGSAVAMQNHPAGATVTAADGSVAFQPAPVSLAVTVGDVQKLGAATIVVEYDPAVLKPISCQRGSQFGIGLCNLTLDLDGDSTFDAVRFNAISITGVTVGPESTAPLAQISWQAVSAGSVDSTTILTVTIDTLTDVDGIPIPAVTQNGRVTLLPAPAPAPRIFLPLVTS